MGFSMTDSQFTQGASRCYYALSRIMSLWATWCETEANRRKICRTSLQ
jgi:hypothetical protein